MGEFEQQSSWAFETRAVHTGQEPDPVTGVLQHFRFRQTIQIGTGLGLCRTAAVRPVAGDGGYGDVGVGWEHCEPQ